MTGPIDGVAENSDAYGALKDGLPPAFAAGYNCWHMIGTRASADERRR